MTDTCRECNGRGVVVARYRPATYVSHDMAMDAGDMALEGTVYEEEEYEFAECAACRQAWNAREAAQQQEGK